MKLLFDTNILIYHFNGQLNDAGTRLLIEGFLGEGAYSVISRIEVLGFDQPEAEDTQARRVLSALAELPLTDAITEQTIQLRKRLQIKVPDAIIAATALEHSLRLVTRNVKDFSEIETLEIVNPFKADS